MASGSKKFRRRATPAAQAGFVSRWFTRRNAVILWWFALLWFVGMAAYPVSSGFTRLGCSILAGVWLAGSLGLGWRYRTLRWTLIVLYAVAGLFAVAPGRHDYDRLEMRQETVRALERYEGVRYYWGGENRLGIDCSGLVRRGAIDALFLSGLRQVNPALVRKAVALWWRDTSAREMGAEAAGKAQRLYDAKAIAGMDDSKLHPGDFAITQNGIHAMAYLGNHLWLQASPDAGRVERVNPHTTRNPWFQIPVTLLRWHHLEIPQLVGRRRGMQ